MTLFDAMSIFIQMCLLKQNRQQCQMNNDKSRRYQTDNYQMSP